MTHVWIRKVFIQTIKFHRSKHKHKGERKTLKGFISRPTTLSLTDSYQCLTPTYLFGFQSSTALIFKLSHFYVFSILITYCIILLRIITWVTNLYFLTPVDKPGFVYYLYPVFSSVILMWAVKPGHHLYTQLTFVRNDAYIQSP